MVLSVGLLPLLFGFSTDSDIPIAFVYFVVGLGIALQGILDHWLLVRMLKSVVEVEHGKVV